MTGARAACQRPRMVRGVPLLALLVLSGCGLVAAPCRVTSAALDIVPVVGHVASTPTDACAQAIDPKP
ncbi:MAG: phosphoribosylglycinamide formyltransferase [Acetobacteraceae bacterium]|nr:phosphoribosylglycinamide formyltransferase [Acetobacteraceae bacterium]